MRTLGRRPAARGAVALVVAVAAGAVLGWPPQERPAHPPGGAGPATVQIDPGPVSPPASAPDPAARQRARLGGLASLLTADDPLLRACADRGRPATRGGRASAAATVAAVTAQTEALRERELAAPPEVQLLEDAAMTDRVREFFGDQWDAERLDRNRRVLTALGAITPGTDLAELRIDAFAAQVSGYHLADQRVIGLRTGAPDPDALSPLERVVLAHEVEHALSFAHLGRPADHRDRDETADAARASAAVVEGSAAATMLQYAATVLDPAAQVGMRAELAARAAAGTLAGYSPYLLAELQFPYVEGLRYTCRRWRSGGWAAVDAGYRDPPASTAGILFPERHAEQPRQPPALTAPGERWRREDIRAFGAAELEWLLAAPGGDPAAGLDRPRERVAAWDGGELVLWTDGTATAVGLALVDRGETGAPPLCDTVREWYAAAFPRAAADAGPPPGGDDGRPGGGGTRLRFAAGAQDAVLTCTGAQVRLGIAPTLGEAETISATR